MVAVTIMAITEHHDDLVPWSLPNPSTSMSNLIPYAMASRNGTSRKCHAWRCAMSDNQVEPRSEWSFDDIDTTLGTTHDRVALPTQNLC